MKKYTINIDTCNSAFLEFAKLHKLPIKGSAMEIRRERLHMDSVELEPKEIGAFAHVMKRVYFIFFSSRRIENKTRFHWVTLCLRYEFKEGGSNGTDYPIGISNSIYYDKETSKWITAQEFFKK